MAAESSAPHGVLERRGESGELAVALTRRNEATAQSTPATAQRRRKSRSRHPLDDHRLDGVGAPQGGELVFAPSSYTSGASTLSPANVDGTAI
jgi:hypothetical protein